MTSSTLFTLWLLTLSIIFLLLFDMWYLFLIPDFKIDFFFLSHCLFCWINAFSFGFYQTSVLITLETGVSYLSKNCRYFYSCSPYKINGSSCFSRNHLERIPRLGMWGGVTLCIVPGLSAESTARSSPFCSCVAQTPVVAIMTTGGGMRSLTALYGSLRGLKKLEVLDCATYLTGLSGTTW